MTVAELIEELQEFDPEMPVHFAYPSGDYWKTTLTKPVSVVEIGTVEWSDYHRENRLIEDGEEELGENSVIVIS